MFRLFSLSASGRQTLLLLRFFAAGLICIGSDLFQRKQRETPELDGNIGEGLVGADGGQSKKLHILAIAKIFPGHNSVHELNHHCAYHHGRMLPFPSKSPHLLCDSVVRVLTLYALWAKNAYLHIASFPL